MITHVSHKTKMKIIHFSNKLEIRNKTKVNTTHLTIHLIINHQMMMTIINQIYTQEYRPKPPRQNQAFQNTKNYP